MCPCLTTRVRCVLATQRPPNTATATALTDGGNSCAAVISDFSVCQAYCRVGCNLHSHGYCPLLSMMGRPLRRLSRADRAPGALCLLQSSLVATNTPRHCKRERGAGGFGLYKHGNRHAHTVRLKKIPT